MTRTGRPRKPTATIKLHNTYRMDRREETEPEPKIMTAPKCPDWLHVEARKMFKRLAPSLASQRCLTDWDVDLLAAACFEFGEYVKICKKIKGNEIITSLMSARQSALKRFFEIAKEFGMTPAARTRLATNPNPSAAGKDPFAELSKRGRKKESA